MNKKEKQIKLKKLFEALKDIVYNTEKSNMWRTDVNYSNKNQTTKEKYPTNYGILWMDVEQAKNQHKKEYESEVYTGSHPEETYIQGTEDNLYIADDSPSLLVEPDVRQKLRDYYKKMGLIS